MNAPTPKKQPWIDYLLDTISKEKDDAVTRYSLLCNELVSKIRDKTIDKPRAEQICHEIYLTAPLYASNCKRTKELFLGFQQFALKEFDNM